MQDPFYSCDYCNRVFDQIGVPMWECRACDVDACRSCMKDMWKQLEQQAQRDSDRRLLQEKVSADRVSGCLVNHCPREGVAAKLLFGLPSIFVIVAGLVTGFLTHSALGATAEGLTSVVRERVMLNLQSELDDTLTSPVFANAVNWHRILRGDVSINFTGPNGNATAEETVRYLGGQMEVLGDGVQGVLLGNVVDNTLVAWNRVPTFLDGMDNSIESIAGGAVKTFNRSTGTRGNLLQEESGLRLRDEPWAKIPQSWTRGPGQQNWTGVFRLVNNYGFMALKRVDTGDGEYYGLCGGFLDTASLVGLLEGHLPSRDSVIFVMEGTFMQYSDARVAPINITLLSEACAAGSDSADQCHQAGDGCKWDPQGSGVPPMRRRPHCVWDRVGLLVATSLRTPAGRTEASDPVTGEKLLPSRRGRPEESADSRIRMAADHILSTGGYQALSSQVEDAGRHVQGGGVASWHPHAVLTHPGDGSSWFFDAFLSTDPRGARWMCVVLIPLDDLLGRTRDRQHEMMLIILVVTAGTFAISAAVTQCVSLPMRKVKKKLDRRARVNEIKYARLNRALAELSRADVT
eukprot:TRINITY_DN35777_c0_g1_i1.p1 TRINITY_DN35777_c0_g1~~TRINITY_DN35777_c0_g1_i1.p1  ORF type:complete len:660 (+),score=178.65 TRINITY_DN35777_c0_g1_i1:258-1982(+)